MIKADLDSYNELLKKVIKLCENLQNIKDVNWIVQILTTCQETVIAVGEGLEKIKLEKDKKAIEKLSVVSNLEQFCELAYEYTQSLDIHILSQMTDVISAVLKDINSIPRTYRVAFLPYKASMWDSLESIWREFAADKDCETSIVAIPYYEADRITNKWEYCYDGELFEADIPIVDFNDYNLKLKKPDLVFVHNPFDKFNTVTTVNPIYYSEELKKYCGKLVYVPYYVNPGFISASYNKLPLLYRSDYIIVQSYMAKETCKEFPYYDNVLALGSPKFDKIIELDKQNVSAPEEWNVNLKDKKCLLLNTTIEDFLESDNYIIDKLYSVFKVALSRNDIVIVWRPHPLLYATIKALRPEYADKYKALVDYYINNNVGVYDKTADISRAVAVSDAYIGSYYSSVIALYEVINKPVFKINNKLKYEDSMLKTKNKAKPEEVFMKLNNRDFYGCYESEKYILEDFIDDLVLNRLDVIKKKQMEEEAGLAANLDGSCGRKVYEYLTNVIRQ